MLIIDDTKRREIIFHFNKKNLEDNTIPMWVIKHMGLTHYVNHIDVSPGVGFSTKETPENPHTKGSIKFRAKLKIEIINTEIIANIW